MDARIQALEHSRWHAIAAAASPPAAAEPELKVNYNWTSPAETAAIKVLQ